MTIWELGDEADATMPKAAKPPIQTMLDSVEWKETGNTVSYDGLPFATHHGVFRLGHFELRCYRLSDGRAIFHADDVDKLLGSIEP